MTICPIALAVGCEKCPAFSFCPLTTVLGDQEKRENGSSRRADLYNKIEEEKPKTDEEDKYQKYAEEELEKNKPLTKDERLALIKKTAEKKSTHDNESW